MPGPGPPMPDFFRNSILVIVTVVAALLFMKGLNLAWPPEKRRTHNELIGWQLSILGTTYAVILGFMLYAVWTNFGAAGETVEQEAGALSNIYSLAGALPEPQRSQMRALAQSYANAAIQQDWPQMMSGQVPEHTLIINTAMWRTLTSMRSASASELTAADHALSELRALTEHRRIRLLQSQSHLPGVLWCVLLVGGGLTIMSCCTFGSESARLHGVQVFAFALLISLCLAAIADINRPFLGMVHVSDAAFVQAQRYMQER
jgi:Protein of unknown function (DUF4239)